MNSQSEKYRNSVEGIGAGVEACWLNAVKIVSGANLLKSQGYYGLALSISILAIEEIGKLILLDGLLFAHKYDKRSDIFEKGFRSHKIKLDALDFFPFLISYLANLDMRFNKEEKFNQTIAIIIEQYKKGRFMLSKWIGEDCNLQKLDEWKQKGFYAHYNSNGQIVLPNNIDIEFCEAILNFSNRIVDSVNFLLKDNILKYMETINNVRINLSSQQILEIRGQAEMLMNKLIELSNDNENEI